MYFYEKKFVIVYVDDLNLVGAPKELIKLQPI
jgi:hypothetical protein